MKEKYDKTVLVELRKQRDELKAEIEELASEFEYIKLIDEIDELKGKKGILIKEIAKYVEKANATDMNQDNMNMRMRLVTLY